MRRRWTGDSRIGQAHMRGVGCKMERVLRFGIRDSSWHRLMQGKRCRHLAQTKWRHEERERRLSAA